MSTQRRKGTGYENHLLEEFILSVFPDASRAPLRGPNDYGDFMNVDGILIEAKKWDRWDVGQWVRTVLKKILRKHGTTKGVPWMIHFAGDKRNGLGDLTLLPTELVYGWLGRMKNQEEHIEKLLSEAEDLRYSLRSVTDRG